jgi:hypothetical protein
MAEQYGSAPQTQSECSGGGRRAEVGILAGLREALSTGSSLLQFAQANGVPESTVRHWVARAQASGAPPSFVRFVESPEGLEVLHRIVVAVIFVLTQFVGGGVRTVCLFLELSGLWRVVAAGYGTQQEAVKSMEEAIVAFGAEERAQLAAKMPAREITVAQDETFHEQPCLVAIEPVSNFILVEQYAKDRRGETWAAAMKQGLDGLPVKLIQSTSDEGASLRQAARDSGMHHSPDLFHPQQDISRATSLPLRRQLDAAVQAASEAALQLSTLLDEAKAYQEQPRGPGRPRDYDKRLAEADAALKTAEPAVEEAKTRREQVRQAARAISSAYHPFDLETGAMRQATEVETDIGRQLTLIEQIAANVSLSERCLALLAKVRRVLPQMVATIAFVHTLIRHRLEVLDLAPALQDVVQRQLIPVCYLEEVARKAPTAQVRKTLGERVASLRAGLSEPECPLSLLAADECGHLWRVARECAQLFQRSSSNVEGRNGVLELRHHSLHQLTPRKLQALTVVHNYATRRPDGTTPAERFFGQKHRGLFEHLVATLPPPRRPAERRAAAN